MMSEIAKLGLILLFNVAQSRDIQNNWMPFLSESSEYNYSKYEPDSCENKFYPNGILESVTCYKNGLIDGWATLYYDNGILRSEIFFVKSKKNGEAKYYNENGSIYMLIGFTKEGECEYLRKILGDDIIMEFYENGDLVKTVFQITEGDKVVSSDTIYHISRRN